MLQGIADTKKTPDMISGNMTAGVSVKLQQQGPHIVAVAFHEAEARTW